MKHGADPFAIYRVIGARLLELRSVAGLTQEQVAARLDPPVTRAAIAMIEAGNQRMLVHTLAQLAAMFKVSLNDLVTLPKLRIAVDDQRDAGGAR